MTNTPTFTLTASSILRGTSTNFSSSFTMTEGTAQATLNLVGGLTGAFTANCTATPDVNPGNPRTCSVSATGLVTVNDVPPTGNNEVVSVVIGGSITAPASMPLTTSESPPPPPGFPTSITLNQGGTPMTSAEQTLNVQFNPASETKIDITTTAPTATTAGRGAAITYTATLHRTGFLTQATAAVATLVTDAASGTTVAVSSQPVTWASGETADRTVSFTVAVPAGLALGGAATYHIEATWDPNSLDAVPVTDKAIGAQRSFTIAAGTNDAVIAIATTAPTGTPDVQRGTGISYTATLTRSGKTNQATNVQVSLVPEGDQRGTTAGPPVTVAFASGDTTKPVTIPVTVPVGAGLGTVTYHFQAVYDPTGTDGAPLDTVTDAARSFTVVRVQPTLTLTPPSGTVNRGQTLNLVATLTNPSGGETLLTDGITIVVPVGMSVGTPTSPGSVLPPAAVPPVAGLVPQTVAVTYASILPNESRVLTVPVTVLDTATVKAGQVDLPVTASFFSAVPVTSLSASSDFELRPDADLTVSVTPDTQDAQKNQDADLTVTLGNLGPDPSTGTKTVTINLSGTGGEIRSAPASCVINTPAKTQAVCTITADIAPGAGGNVTLPIVVRGSTKGQTLTISATVTTAPGSQFDVNTVNNTDDATVKVQESSSDLSITRSPPSVELQVAGGTFQPTQNVTFTATANDAGNGKNENDPAEGVTVVLTIPAQVQVTAVTFPGMAGGACTAPPAAGSAGTVTCTLGDIADGSSVPITVTLKGTTITGPVPLSATAASTNNDPTTVNNVATIDVTVVKQAVDLSVNDVPNAVLKAAVSGNTTGSGDFTVTVTNNSPAPSGPYTLTVGLDGGATAAQLALTEFEANCTTTGNVVTCTGTGLGATPQSFVIHGDINVRGPITVRSTVALDAGSGNQTDANAGNNTDTWTVTRAEADLTLGITPPQTLQKEKAANVTVTVGNAGPDAATGTKTVNVSLAGGSGEFKNPAPAGCTITTTTTATCTLPDPIPAAGSVPLTFKVQSNVAGAIVTVTATLVTTGLEVDLNTTNDDFVQTTVTYTQSSTDLSISTASSPLELVFGSPTKTVSYAVTVVDPDSGANGNDRAEGVVVTIPMPPGVTATAATFAGDVNGTCTGTPAAPASTVTCAIGDLGDGKTVTIMLTLQGTALVVNAPVAATAHLTNNDPNQNSLTAPPNNNTATVLVTVIPQPVDLAVTPVDDRIIQTVLPSDTIGVFTFPVVVTNNSPTYTTAGYRLTVTTAAGVLLSSPDCTPPSAVTVTCAATGLAPGATKTFLITTTISVPGPIDVTATVALDLATQKDLVPANNADTWAVTRNRPPIANPDMGPTVPAGATLVYDVVLNDTDLDSGDVQGAIVTLTPPVAAGFTMEGQKVKFVAGATPATPDQGYKIEDKRGGSATATLKVRVVGPIVRDAEGSFGTPPAAGTTSFTKDIAADRVDATATAINVLAGPLGKRADDTSFPPGTTHQLDTVDQASLNVAGSTVATQDVSGTKVVSYVPAKGYTSDNGGLPPIKAPPDDFAYVTKGRSGTAELFTVSAGVSVEVKNQNPIGVDDLFDVPNSVTVKGFPATNDIDGNTVKDPIAVKRPPAPPSFVFDDEGDLNAARKLKILCIGPVPELDPLTNLPTTEPATVCPSASGAVFKPGWKKAGEELVLETPDSHGKVTVTLIGGTVDEAFRAVNLRADATAVGGLDFAYVVADNYGGAGFGLATATVPNTPPQVIEGVRTVLKNTPTLVVDTKLATQDANGDSIEVKSAVDPTKQGGKVVVGTDSRTITYTPKKDYLGLDELEYTVTDGRSNGTARAILQLNVIEPPTDLTTAGGTAAGGGAAGAPAGSLAATGGDPLPLTAAAGFSLVIGLALVQAGRRRGSRPLLDQARHLRP